MVPTDSEDILEKKVKEIIDQELIKVKFDDLCKRICDQVIEKVHGIDNEHNEIKQMYNDIGERIDILWADSQEDEMSDSKLQTGFRSPMKNSSIIVIDDDEDDKARNSNKNLREIRKETKNTLSCSSTITSNVVTVNKLSLTQKATTSPPNTTKKLEDVISKLTSKKVGKTSDLATKNSNGMSLSSTTPTETTTTATTLEVVLPTTSVDVLPESSSKQSEDFINSKQNSDAITPPKTNEIVKDLSKSGVAVDAVTNKEIRTTENDNTTKSTIAEDNDKDTIATAIDIIENPVKEGSSEYTKTTEVSVDEPSTVAQTDSKPTDTHKNLIQTDTHKDLLSLQQLESSDSDKIVKTIPQKDFENLEKQEEEEEDKELEPFDNASNNLPVSLDHDCKKKDKETFERDAENKTMIPLEKRISPTKLLERNLASSPISFSPDTSSSTPPSLRKFPILGDPPSITRSPVRSDICNASPNENPPELTAFTVIDSPPKLSSPPPQVEIPQELTGLDELSSFKSSQELIIITSPAKIFPLLSGSPNPLFTNSSPMPSLKSSPLYTDCLLTDGQQDWISSNSELLSIKESGFDGIDTNDLIQNEIYAPTSQPESQVQNLVDSSGQSTSTQRDPETKNILSIETNDAAVTTELPPRIHEFGFEPERLVFAKPGKSDIWYQAKLIKEIIKKRGTKYLVGFLSGQKLQQKVDAKCIAAREFVHPEDVELGTRIVAGRPSDTVNSTIQKKYKDISTSTSFTVMFAGTVCELACEANRYRYLVFFDDGYAQYLPLNRLFPVVSTSEEVWDDVSADCQEFIKEYLQEYPFRPLVVTKIGCIMQTEWNGEWWRSRVVSIDSSLVKILFDFDKRSEWIYRGTTRLEPMYNHFIQPAPKAPGRGRKKKVVKEENYVDEKITDPQYGICKYSQADPDGEKQVLEWGKPIICMDKILNKCQEEGTSVSLVSPRVVAPPPAPVEQKVLLHKRDSPSPAAPTTPVAPEESKTLQIPSPRQLKRSSSFMSSASDCSKTSAADHSNVVGPSKRRKEMKVEPLDSDVEPSLTSPICLEVTPTKEEISQEDILGALSALNTSPSDIPSTDEKSSQGTQMSSPGPDWYDGVDSPSRQRVQKPTSPSRSPPKKPENQYIKLDSMKHKCTDECITDRRNMLEEHRLGYTNYLSIPFHLGWKRESAKKLGSYHRDIYYRTPCNKRMRSLSEVTKYILQTNCDNICIDMFCFHSKISCRSQPVKSKTPKVKIDDLSDGRETCPVVLINEISEETPPHLAYISSRNKAEDVYINIDPGFLVCCDCTDNCQDKTKCQCAQLSKESSNAIDGIVDPSAGYVYRRLKECITTGIYECNPNCSCSTNCYNRVVQNGIQLRLQVFMTENRGWGLQCIDDIPKGTFICTYAGQVLNEQTANREGMDYGDEYLAEMDHIEVVERAKEGYESDVPELKDKSYDDSDSESYTESESEDSVINISSDSSDSSDEDTQQPSLKRLRAFIAEQQSNSTEVKEQIKTMIDDSVEGVGSAIPLLKETGNGTGVPSPANTDSTGSLLSAPSPLLAQMSEEDIAACQVTLKRIPSMDLPRRIDSMSDDSFMTDITSPDNSICFGPEIEKQKSPLFVPEQSDPPPVVESKSTENPSGVKEPKKNGENIIQLAKKSTCQLACKRTGTGIIISKKDMKPVKEGDDKSKEKKQEKVVSTRSLYNGDNQMFIIDAKSFGNVGRFMNHSCAPNLFVQNVMVDTHDLRFPWVAFFAHQNIPAYTELTWDYSYEIGSVPGKELFCKCGAKTCKGRLL